jgi:hypothetical protein
MTASPPLKSEQPSPSWPTERLGWGVAAALLIAATGWSLTAGSEPSASMEAHSPAVVHPVAGLQFPTVSLTDQGIERIGLEVVDVVTRDNQVQVPYASLVYAADGSTWVYVELKAMEFVRQSVSVSAIGDGVATLSNGPKVGQRVVSLGSAELYGAEFEVGH